MLKLMVPVGLVPPLSVAVSWIVPPAVCVAVAVLLAWLLSLVAELTVAVFVMVPASDAVTVMVMAGAAPGARLARVQVTTPPAWLQVQPLPVALTKVTPAGSVSLTLTEVAVLGPALLTLSV